MDDPQQEPRQHQADRSFRIDPWPTDTGRIEIGHFATQPAEVKDLVDAGKDVIVGDEVTQRSANEELELIAGPTADYAILQALLSERWNQQPGGFSTAPPRIFA